VIQSPGLLWTILFFLAAIGPLIFIHEMGHYLVARWCGVKVEAFSIGFYKEIFGWTDRRGTRWKIGWLPLGGYVMFAGDANEASAPSGDWQSLPEAERSQILHAKPVWQRMAISAAGPLANFLTAILIYMALFASLGEWREEPVVNRVLPQSAAAEAGLKVGDRIVALNDREAQRFADISDYVALRPNQMITLTVRRDDRELLINVTPREQTLKSRFGTKATRGFLGVGPPRPSRVDHSLIELPVAAINHTGRVLRSIVDGLGQIIMGYISPKELGGPIMIAKLSGEIATYGWIQFISFVALISIQLGFINLLPVPMLDGGHLLFQSIEAIRRKPVSLVAQEWAYRMGFMLVISLMVFATINDIGRFMGS
jgi:regulator of sigma E protease